jgi:hypothetical protein
MLVGMIAVFIASPELPGPRRGTFVRNKRQQTELERERERESSKEEVEKRSGRFDAWE